MYARMRATKGALAGGPWAAPRPLGRVGEEGDNYDTSSFKVSVKVNGAAELGVV